MEEIHKKVEDKNTIYMEDIIFQELFLVEIGNLLFSRSSNKESLEQ
jgi:hypothetical protein